MQIDTFSNTDRHRIIFKTRIPLKKKYMMYLFLLAVTSIFLSKLSYNARK